MAATRPSGQTNRELSRSLRTPVARFYLCDLHVHSLGSYDVCQAGRFEKLPEALRQKISVSLNGSAVTLPLGKEPNDAGQFDEHMTKPDLVQAFLDSLEARRDLVGESEGTSETDNWCVIGITDHNTSTFSASLSQMAWDQRGPKRIVILPGIELDISFEVSNATETCHVHILCLFAPCTKASDIRLAINDARSSGGQAWSFGQPIGNANLADFIQKLRHHSSYPAICIGAHVWSTKGVQKEPTKLILANLEAEIVRLEAELARATTENALVEQREIRGRLESVIQRHGDRDAIHLDVLRLIGKCGFDALQVRDQSHETHYRRLHRFRDEQGRAVPIVSSDSHTPDQVFSCASGIPYVKISSAVLSAGTPKDVFQEMQSRVLRFGETRTTYASPGAVTHWIEGIEIVRDAQEAKAFWNTESNRSSSDQPFVLALSRNLNCFVGGRGSGKSAGVEALAFVTEPAPFSSQATERVQTDWYKRARATLAGCRIRLVWKSSGSEGIGALPKKALFVSRYFNPNGQHGPLDIRDIEGNAIVDDRVRLPRIRILRVHEIEDTARPENLRKLFDDLCGPRINELNDHISSLRGQLTTQRREVGTVIKRLHDLTAEAGPLRQFGIRKRLFDAVNKPELKTRFQAVDGSEAASKLANRTHERWQDLNVSTSIQAIEHDVKEFFDTATTILLQNDGTVSAAHMPLHAIVKAANVGEPTGHREAVMTGIQTAKEAAFQFDVAITGAKNAFEAEHQAQFDDLVKEGLPGGSSDREAKKRAYEQAVEDHRVYLENVEAIDQLLAARKELHGKLVKAGQERTALRTTRAKQLTEQLARDLDEHVLRIEISAKPMGDRGEFGKWLQTNVEPTFGKYKAHRSSALLDSGLMPADLREILLNESNPDLAILRIARDRAEQGRIDDDDAVKILTRCRGRKRVVLDEADGWDADFVATLPETLRTGVLTFPVTEVAGLHCIDRVLELDEVVLDDIAEVRLNDRPFDEQSEPRLLDELSHGQRCSAILPILLLSGDYPLVIDQPEENLDNRLIRQVIVNILASMKLKRQVIIATHNPNLPVLGDVEQCVVLQAMGRDLSIVVATGNLDSAKVARYITDIMEGGREAFQYRQSIYQCHWSGPVEELPPK